MSENQTRTIWCFDYRNPVPFQVFVRDSANIDDLKDAIKEKERLNDVCASSLVLWQARVILYAAINIPADSDFRLVLHHSER
jgi:Crinkler effector protein N-terminal domain